MHLPKGYVYCLSLEFQNQPQKSFLFVSIGSWNRPYILNREHRTHFSGVDSVVVAVSIYLCEIWFKIYIFDFAFLCVNFDIETLLEYFIDLTNKEPLQILICFQHQLTIGGLTFLLEFDDDFLQLH